MGDQHLGVLVLWWRQKPVRQGERRPQRGERLRLVVPPSATETHGLPAAGVAVTDQQPLFQLVPLLAPEREVPSATERVAMANAKVALVSAQITTDGDVKQARSQVDAARIALDRAQKLLSDRAGSQRDVDNAQAALDIAQQGLNAAIARKQELDKLSLDAATLTADPISILAPQAGLLRNVTSSVDQTVSAGSPLFEVVRLSTLWVRVPIYPGLEPQLARDQPVRVRQLGNSGDDIEVKPVTAPPSADPLAATVHLFYELPNSEGGFHPGERLEVILPLMGNKESLIVPRAAILRDIHGIAWVYVKSAEHEYHRVRVEVHYTTSELAVLSGGPPAGTPVVVNGTAELFGTEFGAGK